jgi:leucokinin receptor
MQRPVVTSACSWKYINIMFFIFHWLAMSNSCYNPCIYGIKSVSFTKPFGRGQPADTPVPSGEVQA